MQPSDLYSMALSQLTQTRSAMLSAAWQAQLDKQSPAARVSAGNDLIQVQGAILSLSNASLTDIASKMSANEQGLTQATKELGTALQDLTQVASVLTTVANVLAVVAKIVPLV
jgi:hypothetical protein